MAYEATQILNPEYHLMAVVLEDLFKCVNSNNNAVAEVTVYELQRPKRGENTYYNRASGSRKRKYISGK